MKTIIGLYPSREAMFRALQVLEQSQVPVEQVSMVGSEAKVKIMLAGYQKQVLSNYARWGVVLGLVFFGLYNLVGMFCDCGLSIFDIWIELETLILLLTAGAFIGLASAYYLRVERLNGGTRFYTRNIHRGGVVVAVEAAPEHVDAITEILHLNGGSAIKCLETRLNHYLNHKPEYI